MSNASRLQYLKFSLKPQRCVPGRGAVQGCNISNFHSNHSRTTANVGNLVAAISQIFTQTTATGLIPYAYSIAAISQIFTQTTAGALTPDACCNISNFHSNHSAATIWFITGFAAISQIFTQTTAFAGTDNVMLPLQYLKFSLKPQLSGSHRLQALRCNISNFHSNHSAAHLLVVKYIAAISQIFTQTTANDSSGLLKRTLQYLKFSLKPQQPKTPAIRSRSCNISNFHSNHSG